MSHTTEPWSINEWTQPASNISIGAVGTTLIARVILRDVSINEHKANAMRIVAAVNACNGIPIDELELDTPAFVKVLNERAQLRRQRDELLAALTSIAQQLEHHGETARGNSKVHFCYHTATAAIAKAEEI